MKTINLIKLTLHNFKGIQDFVLDIQGGNAAVYGDNATGKTTLFDAFNWLLFGKDSQNKADFEIKYLDGDSFPRHKLSHEVEAVLGVSGFRQVSLKRVYAEKWTKKRGNTSEEFTGHETKYFLEDVPVQKKEYDAFIADNIPEDIFKLITSPLFFNEQLKWQDRRKTLLEICGDISDDEIISSNKSLAELPQILQGRSLDDYRKILKTKLSAINKELELIPVRVDEATRALPDISQFPPAEIIQPEIKELKEKVNRLQTEISRIKNGGEIAEAKKSLSVTETRLIDIQNKHKKEVADKAMAKRMEAQKLLSDALSIEDKILKKTTMLEGNTKLIEANKAEIESLRKLCHEVNGKIFEHEQSDICPACGQPLPSEMLTEAIERALADYNQNKAETLKKLIAAGKQLSEKTKELQAQNIKIDEDIVLLDVQRTDTREKSEKLYSESKKMESSASLLDDTEYINLIEQKEALQKLIESLSADTSEMIESVEGKISELSATITAHEGALLVLAQHEGGQERIKELEAQQKTLAVEFESLQKELFLTEEFTRAKVNIMEDKISGKFKFARFNMFKEQVNGGLEECCEVTYQGVPYNSLNNAARINIGLDIINTLSAHYGFSAPIFVDNREAVTKLTDTTAQIISLVVSEPDKTLRVEREVI